MFRISGNKWCRPRGSSFPYYPRGACVGVPRRSVQSTPNRRRAPPERSSVSVPRHTAQGLMRLASLLLVAALAWQPAAAEATGGGIN